MIDWEFSKYGPASSDLGQFVAESWNLAHFKDREGGLAFLGSFRDSYLASVDGDGEGVNGGEVACHAMAHVVVWTPVVGWGDEQAVKRCEGICLEHLLKGWEAWEAGSEGEESQETFEWWPKP